MIRTLTLWLFSWSALWAQVVPTQHLEILCDDKKYEDFGILPLAEKGLIVTRKVDNPGNGVNELFHFTKYDSTMTLRWETEFKLRHTFTGLLSYHNHECLYWLCSEPASQKVEIWKIWLETGETELIEGEIQAIDEVSQFIVLGNKAFLAGKYNDRPVVVGFSFFDKSSTVLRDIHDNNLVINGLTINESTNELLVSTRTTRKGKCQLNLHIYSYDGKLERKETPIDDSGKTLLPGKLIPLPNGKILVTGTYSTNCSDYSRGLYFTHLSNEPGYSPIRYVPFSDLEHFFNYLKPSQQERMKNRITEWQKQGKEPKNNYLIQIQDLTRTPDGYVLVAEAYYTQSVSTMTTRPNSRKGDSYHFTHTILCGLDLDGNLRWDNSLALDDQTSGILEQQVQLQPVGKNLILAYPHDDKVRSLMIEKNKVIGKVVESPLLPEEVKKNLTGDDSPTLEEWYGPYFLTWGIRRIPNPYNESSKTVFFVYKLAYQPDNQE
ncbi:MAG: hypothetical protein QM669_08380 [Siphonobacter sp.]